MYESSEVNTRQKNAPLKISMTWEPAPSFMTKLIDGGIRTKSSSSQRTPRIPLKRCITRLYFEQICAREGYSVLLRSPVALLTTRTISGVTSKHSKTMIWRRLSLASDLHLGPRCQLSFPKNQASELRYCFLQLSPDPTRICLERSFISKNSCLLTQSLSTGLWSTTILFSRF